MSHQANAFKNSYPNVAGAALVLASVFAFLQAQEARAALSIPVTVTEPAGFARSGEPVTSGIPLPAGAQTQNWALFDGALEIPLQITSLSGRTPWILLDFQTTIGANGVKQLTLREQAAAAQPSDPVVISESGNDIVVTTGPIKALINKARFNLFEGVWFDRNQDRTYADSEKIFTSSGDNLLITDSVTGQTFSGAGAPDKISWEYRGPMRSTLRVDGRYRNASGEFLAYTTRLTFYAGRANVKIEHVVRNSVQFNERHAKIKSATAKLGGGSQKIRAARSGEINWAKLDASGVELQLIPRSYLVTGFGAAGVDVDAVGGMILPDLGYHGATLIAEFSDQVTAAESPQRTAMSRGPLFALALPSWYSDYGELSTTQFSTLDDEKEAYRRWGWTWRPDQEPSAPRSPNFSVDWQQSDVHGDTESDDLWQNALMYLRTGQYGYLDRVRGWANYFKWDYPCRTDGFSFAWDSDYEGRANAVRRPLIPLPSLTAAEQAYIAGDVADGRVCGTDLRDYGADHMYGWGLLDYYYLTGDKDALEAAAELGEVSERVYNWRNPGVYDIGSTGRQGARNLILATRIWESTQDPRWQRLANHIMDLYLAAPSWYPQEGMYLSTVDVVIQGSRHIVRALNPHHTAYLSQGFDRYYRLTGNAAVRDRLIKMAQFAKTYALDPVWNYSTRTVALDYPTPGAAWYSDLEAGADSLVNPYHTIAWVDMLVRGYRLSGDATLLDRAMYYWARGSKTAYFQKVSVPPMLAGANQVGRFLNYKFGSPALFYDLNCCMNFAHLLFRDALQGGGAPPTPTPPPTPIPNLSLTANPSPITAGQSSTLTWSSTGTTSCTASGGWSGSRATSGSQSVSPPVTTTYTLTCTGTGGSIARSVTVVVSPVPIPSPPPTPPPTPSPTPSPSPNPTPTPTPPPSPQPPGIERITFRPRVEGRTDLADIIFTVKIFSVGGASPLAVVSGSGPSFLLPPSVSIASGTYDLVVEARYYLRKRQSSIRLSTDQGLTLNALNAGDLNEDQIINSLDWSLMSPKWGTGDPLADLNKDGKVNSIDFSLMSNNWSKIGDDFTPTAPSPSPTPPPSPSPPPTPTPTPPAPTPTLVLAANPSSIATGQSSTLTWSTTDATSCTASGGWAGAKATLGSQSVSPAVTTTYTLICTGAGGSVARSVAISVIVSSVPPTPTPTPPSVPAPTLTFTANPTSITAGQSSILTWSTTDATSCTASGGWSGVKATSGSESVSPQTTITYSLTCTGTGGSVTKSVTVSVSAPSPPTPPPTPPPPGQVSILPTSLTFVSQEIDSTSAAQTVTITNNGSGAIRINNPIFSSGNFVATNNCGVDISVGGNCVLNAMFRPMKVGDISGTITLGYGSVAGGPTIQQAISLTGRGISSTAPPATPIPPPSPDAAFLAQLQNLPDNGWLAANPKLRSVYQSTITECTRTVQSGDPTNRTYSGLAYGGGAIFDFGGGHSSHPGNDVDLFTIGADQWQEQYPVECPLPNSTEARSIAGAGGSVDNMTPQGRPYTQHTYQSFAYDAGRRRFIGLVPSGTWAFDPSLRKWTYLAGLSLGTPSPISYMDNILTFYDPASGKTIAILTSGDRGVHTFDPATNSWRLEHPFSPSFLTLTSYNSMIGAYNPDRNEFAVVFSSPSGGPRRLFTYRLASDLWTEIVSFPDDLKGTIPNFGYDTKNHRMIFLMPPVLGQSGRPDQPVKVWVWDPAADAWSSLAAPASAPPPTSDSGNERAAFHYDPLQNIFVYLGRISAYCASPGPGGACGGPTKTWIYRYKR